MLQTVLDGREGVMPEWGTVLTGMGGNNAVDYVVAYVRALSKPDQSLYNDYMAAQGKKLYNGLCVACHGVEGKGNQAMGAPDLTDDYWLYGNSTAALRQSIAKGRHGIDARASPVAGRDARAPGGRLRLVAVEPAVKARRTGQGTLARRPSNGRTAMTDYTEPRFDHPPRPLAQRIGAIAWPSFFAAGVATMVFFAFVDPLALRDLTFPSLPRPASWATAWVSSCSGWPPPPRACSPGCCCARPAASTARCVERAQ